MYTSHGWYIPGTSRSDPIPSKTKCGGPDLCPTCALQIATYTKQHEIIDIPAEFEELPYERIEQLTHDELLRSEAMGLAIQSAGAQVYTTHWYIGRATAFEKYLRDAASMGDTNG